MVRVLGNSVERLKVNDLNDVIYYKQQKEYTDQDFDNSRDLQRFKNNGSITILEQRKTVNISSETVSEQPEIKHVSSSINQEDIKRAVSEVLSGLNQSETKTTDLKKLISEVIVDRFPGAPDSQEIKKVVSEVLADFKPDNNTNITAILQSMIPLITDTIRHEVARIQVVSTQGDSKQKNDISSFVGPEYIPSINTEGMVSSIKGEERTSSGGSVSNSLDALKKLRNK